MVPATLWNGSHLEAFAGPPSGFVPLDDPHAEARGPTSTMKIARSNAFASLPRARIALATTRRRFLLTAKPVELDAVSGPVLVRDGQKIVVPIFQPELVIRRRVEVSLVQTVVRRERVGEQCRTVFGQRQ